MTAKKPAALHKAAGNYRPSRHASPSLPIQAPEPPDDLSEGALSIWHILSGQLVAAGILSEIDGIAFRALVESVDLYRQAMQVIHDEGFTVKTKHGLVLNPAVRLRTTTWNEIVKLARQFGLTPAARTGMGSTGEPDDDDIADILRVASA